MLATVDGALADDPNVDGVMPILDARVSVVNETKQQAEPDMILIGADPARFADFGGLKGTNGDVDRPRRHRAGRRRAQPRRRRTSSTPRSATRSRSTTRGAPHSLTVAAIAEDTYLSGIGAGARTSSSIPAW